MSSSPTRGKSQKKPQQRRGQKKRKNTDAPISGTGFFERGSGALRISMDKYSTQSPFPPFKVYKLPYTTRFALTSTDGGSSLGTQVTFRLNSVFDPELSAAGHQPYGFDALALAYNRYKVLACRVKITLTDPTADGIQFVWCILNPSNASDTIAALDPSAVAERQQAGTVFINNTGSQVKVVQMGIPICLASGITKLQFDADPDNWTAAVSGNPGNVAVLAMAICSIRSATPAVTIVANVEMEFQTLFYQRKIMATS